MDEKINCLKCKHYYVTWDKDSPKGCRLYGFKSKEMPALVVERNSGHSCLSFEEKEARPKKPGLDLDRDDLW